MVIISFREWTYHKQEFNSKHIWPLSLICELVNCNFNVFLFIRIQCFSAEWLRDVACHSKWGVYCWRATVLVWIHQTSGPVRTESLIENCSSFSDAALSFILECSTCGLVVGTMRGIFGNVPLQYCGIHLSSQKIHGYINMLLSGVRI